MRLLSNLYKQRFITNESESRVINSNTLAYRILEEQSRALAKTREPEQPQAESGGFVEGIAAPQVETIDYEAEAKEKAEEILAQANAEADEIRKAAREEADEIRKQAQEQGQAEGLEQGMQEGAAVYDAKLESIGKREQQLRILIWNRCGNWNRSLYIQLQMWFPMFSMCSSMIRMRLYFIL